MIIEPINFNSYDDGRVSFTYERVEYIADHTLMRARVVCLHPKFAQAFDGNTTIVAESFCSIINIGKRINFYFFSEMFKAFKGRN